MNTTNSTTNEILQYLQSSRIVLSFLFALGGLIFIVLFLDSHYKNLAEAAMNTTMSSAITR